MGGDTSLVTVLARRYLDAKKSIYVVEIASKIYILGASTDSLRLIAEITDEDEIREIKTRTSATASLYKERSFKKVLSGVNETFEGQEEREKPAGPSSVGAMKNFQEQIAKIKRILRAKQ